MSASTSWLAALLIGTAPSPSAMTVPEGLRALTCNPEPSGLAWAAPLERYLVVSDDTGLRERGTWHAPFVLAMDRRGVLDERPVPIGGLAVLNDAEAIAAGPDGTYFLLTSHAPNKKGKLKAGRSLLVALRLDGRSLVVEGSLDLREAVGSEAIARTAGVDPAGRLDIEGLAYRLADGALYLGLKSPLGAGGEAVILRLDDARGAIGRGRIAPGALTRWAGLTLEVEALDPSQERQTGKITKSTKPSQPRPRVRQGVADLVFLPDGSLVVLGNSPKGLPSDGGGAAWWLRAEATRGMTTATAGKPTLPTLPTLPMLIGRFRGLKPEGVALSPTGDRLVIVFDRDQEQPLWLDAPLPR